MPSFVRDISPYMPTYHLAQLARSSVGVKAEGPWTNAAWLLGYGAVFFALTFYAIRRGETSKFH